MVEAVPDRAHLPRFELEEGMPRLSGRAHPLLIASQRGVFEEIVWPLSGCCRLRRAQVAAAGFLAVLGARSGTRRGGLRAS